MAITHNLPIPVVPGDTGVLIFHTWRKKIPQGIQVLHQCGGGTSATAVPVVEDPSTVQKTVKNVRLGFDSFNEQCSIRSVVVSEGENGYCRVYVNFEKNSHEEGREAWWVEGNAYKPFLRGLFSESYKNVTVRVKGQKTSLQFSDKHANGPVEVKIVFVPLEGLVA